MPDNWLPVPHQTQQQSADCLAACAAMTLAYLGRSTPYDRLLELLKITPDLGAPFSNLKRLNVLNIQVEYGAGTLDVLSDLLAHGIPCIVSVNTLHLSYWAEVARHAIVVVGVTAERVYLNDPFFEMAPQSVARLEFELAWDEMDNAYAALTA